jgi:nicotinamidase-related amidase
MALAVIEAMSPRGVALLLIDVINDLDFEGSAELIRAADTMARPLARLRRRAVRAGIPIVYVNDNFGQWRSDFRQTVRHCTSRRSPGRRISLALRPSRRDYFVLKPKHSGFFATTLETLLRALGVRTVILAGIAANICVLFTANDAYMRELRLFVPSDCVASNTEADTQRALVQMATVLKADVRPSARLVFSRGAPTRAAGRAASS